jgi:hypothetical protein
MKEVNWGMRRMHGGIHMPEIHMPRMHGGRVRPPCNPLEIRFRWRDLRSLAGGIIEDRERRNARTFGLLSCSLRRTPVISSSFL